MTALPGQPLILAASPRAGNSLLAARTFAAAYAEISGRTDLHPLALSDYPVLPCVDCGVCSDPAARFPAGRPGDLCPLSGRDRSAELFGRLLSAPFAVIAAPVYFYHLPAGFKALMDRCQLFWQAAGKGQLEAEAGRTAYVMLLGARKKGEKMFAGSLLTLKYALAPFGFALARPLLLRGLEEADDLRKNAASLDRIRRYAAGAARREAAGWTDYPAKLPGNEA